MNKENIPKKEFKVRHVNEVNEYGVKAIAVESSIDQEEIFVFRGVRDMYYKEAEEIAELIAESLNVFSQTNMTPKELWDVYSTALKEGAKLQQPKIEQLQQQRDEAIKIIDEYKKEHEVTNPFIFNKIKRSLNNTKEQ